MKEEYLPYKFRKDALALIAIMDEIVTDYADEGYMLTVRQIYYQLVARDIVPNTVQSYERVQATLNKARLAGLIDWDAIEDRTRSVLQRSFWDSPNDILEICANQYHEDIWDTQPNRIIVIVEKEALAGVLDRVCQKWSIPLLPARGYPSATTLREMAKTRIMCSVQKVVVLHLGDHDPSGMDMTRDLLDRLRMFSRYEDFMLERLALNMDQIIEQKPPPNPAKTTDARYKSYRQRFGERSWELDALKPQYINDLVEERVKELIEMRKWKKREKEIEHVKGKLLELAKNFEA